MEYSTASKPRKPSKPSKKAPSKKQAEGKIDWRQAAIDQNALILKNNKEMEKRLNALTARVTGGKVKRLEDIDPDLKKYKHSYGKEPEPEPELSDEEESEEEDSEDEQPQRKKQRKQVESESDDESGDDSE